MELLKLIYLTVDATSVLDVNLSISIQPWIRMKTHNILVTFYVNFDFTGAISHLCTLCEKMAVNILRTGDTDLRF